MKTILIFVLVAISAISAIGQQDDEKKNFVELRGGHPYYDYEEYSRVLPKGYVFTFLHLKEAGAHEFSIGLGKNFSYKEVLTVTPTISAVFGSHGQRGITLGAYVDAEKDKWKARAFIGRFTNIKGRTDPYTAMDVGDITRTVTKRYDVGLSTTFFCQGGCEVKTGPIVRRNDKLGAWEFSYRFGRESNEARVSRTFSF